tara:strand:+ start:1467 stop:1763 length:297 start_codon:yes stop_codon:yes gene_type:complete
MTAEEKVNQLERALSSFMEDYSRATRTSRSLRIIAESARELVREVEHMLVSIPEGVVIPVNLPLVNDRLYEYYEAVKEAGEIRIGPACHRCEGAEDVI